MGYPPFFCKPPYDPKWSVSGGGSYREDSNFGTNWGSPVSEANMSPSKPSFEIIWGFTKNGGTPKWLVYKGKIQSDLNLTVNHSEPLRCKNRVLEKPTSDTSELPWRSPEMGYPQSSSIRFSDFPLWTIHLGWETPSDHIRGTPSLVPRGALWSLSRSFGAYTSIRQTRIVRKLWKNSLAEFGGWKEPFNIFGRRMLPHKTVYTWGLPKIGVLRMDSLEWNILLKWMMTGGTPTFKTPPPPYFHVSG